MKGIPTIDPGIEAVSELGALAPYDAIWMVDGRDYISECGSLMSYGEIWVVESHGHHRAGHC